MYVLVPKITTKATEIISRTKRLEILYSFSHPLPVVVCYMFLIHVTFQLVLLGTVQIVESFVPLSSHFFYPTQLQSTISDPAPPRQFPVSNSSITLASEVSTSFLSYSLSTITSRALPDVRDGLKPVHRRVLYACHNLNLHSNSPHRKSARIVGETMGRYHPHGDSSVYSGERRSFGLSTVVLTTNPPPSPLQHSSASPNPSPPPIQ